jgi:hypothetical protein
MVRPEARDQWPARTKRRRHLLAQSLRRPQQYPRPSRVLSLDAPGLRIARVSGVPGLTTGTRPQWRPATRERPGPRGCPQHRRGCGPRRQSHLRLPPCPRALRRPRWSSNLQAPGGHSVASGPIVLDQDPTPVTAPQDQLCFHHQRSPHESSGSQHPMTRRSPTIRVLWSSQLQTAWRAVASVPRSSRGSCRPWHLSDGILRRSFAWSFGAQLPGQRPIVKSGSGFSRARFCRETIQPRTWHGPETGTSLRSTSYAPRAALWVGRPPRSPRLPTRTRRCRLRLAPSSRHLAWLRLYALREGGSRPPRRRSCPCAPGGRPVGRIPRLGRVGIPAGGPCLGSVSPYGGSRD